MKIKKVISLLLAVIMGFSVLPVSVFGLSEGDVVVLYTNDVHCAIDDYAVLAAYKTQLESEGNTVITVDVGDAIQGEVIGSLTNGEAVIDLMNAVGYDYAVPGNHEFDYGMEVFLDIAENKAEYEYISANFTDLRTLLPVLEPFGIKDVNGLKIAFVGITTPESVTKSTPEYFKDENGNFIYGFPTFDMQDGVLYQSVQDSVDEAIEQGADVVIAVGHLGILGISENWKSTDIIANTNGIDAFIDAHSHEKIEGDTYKNKDNEEVILSSTQTKFEYFGKLTISENGIKTELIETAEVDVASMSDEAKNEYDRVKNIVDGYNEQIAYLYDPVGVSEVKLIAYDETGNWLVRKSETNMGDFVADAYRYVTGADVAICNGGGVRSEIEAGSVARIDVMNVNPWNNEMCVIEATGQQIADVLEHGVCEYPQLSGGFFQVSGVTFEVDAWKESPVIKDAWGNFVKINDTLDRRVRNIKIGGVPIDLEKTYTLAGSTYVLTQGGDGLTMLDGAKVISQQGLPCDSDMLLMYFEEVLGKRITAEKYGNPAGDGRIKINTTDPIEECEHMCHKKGIKGFVWKIVRFFCKIFKINPLCDCGTLHY